MMKIEYENHYDAAYWEQRKTYRDENGHTKLYTGPSLAWEGFQFVADALKNILPPGSLLDIGCAGGDLMQRLAKYGYDVYGVDISKHALRAVPKQLHRRVSLADITTCPEYLETRAAVWPFPTAFPNTFTNIISTDLLEHIYESDLDTTFDWMINKCDEIMFLLVAITTGEEFVHIKGQDVPLRWEGTAIAGHVNVRKPSYWAKFFKRHGMIIDWNRMYIFQMQREQIPSWQGTAGWDHSSTWVLKKRK